MNMQIAVACRNAAGSPELPVFTVATNLKECELGVHYDKAETLVEEAGYEAPL